LAVPTFL